MLTPLRALRRRLPGRDRDERGATAIITAFMCIVLFGIAALSVDLGNAFARRTDNQTQADYGALAAARLQTGTASASMSIPTDMANAVASSMNNNQPQDDTSACWRTQTCIVASQLTDGQLANGEIRYCGTGGPSCGTNYASTVKGLQVFAPRNKVDYGFANLLGVPSGSVQADALVNVFTAGQRVMPMYAVQGCDYGLQTLADPATGHVVTPTVVLAHNSDANGTKLSADSQEVRDSSGTVVTTIVHNSTGNTLTFDASKWSNSRYIGFFRLDNTDPALVVRQNTWWLSTDATKTNLNTGTGYTSNPGRTVTLNIPDSVAATEAMWYVRVFNGPDATGTWSPVSEALPIRVGEVILECPGGSSSGNFGTLKFPRTDVPTSNQIPANIALGLQKPMAPVVHAWAVANPTLAGTCSNGVNGALTAPNGAVTLVDGVNCVDTDTGLAANVATEGLVQGGTYGKGVLRENTTTNCDPQGGSDERTLPIHSNPKINDDVLTCFFTNGTTSIADIAKESYSGGAVLDDSILRSPRFFYVPVLAVEPTSGGSAKYSIIDFRAAFLTDETATATAVKGSHTGTTNNGVWVQGQDIKMIKVIFFDDEALPIDGDIPVIDYLGTGNRVIRLID